VGKLALRVLGELISGRVLILNFCFGFEPSLLFFDILLGFYRFSCLLLTLRLFLLLDDLLELFWLFGLLGVLYGVLDSNFKLCAFFINRLIKGEIEKPSGQFLGLIVISH
jgi:hypothetical protein